MNSIKKITAYIMIAFMMISCLVSSTTIRSHAATASFSIGVSSSNVSKGDTITVTVTVSCSSAIGSCSYCVSYDSSVLEYTSGSGYGGGGTVKCAGYGDGSSTSNTCSLTFTAVGVGSCNVSTGSAEVYSWDEETCSVSNSGVTINVTSGSTTEATTEAATESATEASGDDATTEAATETTTEATTEAVSTDSSLASLTITPGTLDPEFDSSTYSYSTTVASGTTELAINALATSSAASVSISGNEGFEAGGSYTISIKVTAESGDISTYEITVNVSEAVESRYVMTVDDVDYYFTADYTGLTIPEGFAQTTVNKDDTDIILYVSPNGTLTCAYLTNEDGSEGAWYIVDLDEKTIAPFINVASAYMYFIILEPDDSVSTPSGYYSTTYDFDGNDVTVFASDSASGVIIVYAMTADTDPALYRYDTSLSTFVTYKADSVSTATTSDDEDATESATTDRSMFKTYFTFGAIIFVLLVIIIALVCVLVTISKEAENGDDPDGDDPDGSEPADTDATEGDDDYTEPDSDDEQVDPSEGETDVVDEGSHEPQAFHIPTVEPEAQPEQNIDSAFAQVQMPPTNVKEAPEDDVPLETRDSAFVVPTVEEMTPKQTDDIIKQAAKFSYMNTSDLADVFDMAKNITDENK